MTNLDHQHTITPGDAAWPSQLDDLDAPPERLHVMGENLDLLSRTDLVTMTGSRASTAYGNYCAQDISLQLSDKGRSLVTGGAYGIDTEVLHGALTSTEAPPIVVLGSGLDVLYPHGNSDLLMSVVTSGGLLVSEYEEGTRPNRSRSLRRGQLLAALAAQTVIVEAGLRSGSRKVACCAGDMGRDVAAVPGPITSAASAGNHAMIADGRARLVASAADVMAIQP